MPGTHVGPGSTDRGLVPEPSLQKVQADLHSRSPAPSRRSAMRSRCRWCCWRSVGCLSERGWWCWGQHGRRPTQSRNHNGYLLLWDAEGLLFGTGRGNPAVDAVRRGFTASRITCICTVHGITAWAHHGVHRACSSGCPWTRCRIPWMPATRRRTGSCSPGSVIDGSA